MDTYHQNLFVLAAVKYPDATTLWKSAGRSPQEVVIEFETGRLLETEYLTSGRIHALHNGANRTVFASRVHGLKHQEHGVSIAGSQDSLEFIEIAGRFFAMFAEVSVAPG
jgi:hypothetical protein